MDVAACGKTKLFRIWKQSRNDEEILRGNKDAKRVVYMAMNIISESSGGTKECWFVSRWS